MNDDTRAELERIADAVAHLVPQDKYVYAFTAAPSEGSTRAITGSNLPAGHLAVLLSQTLAQIVMQLAEQPPQNGPVIQ